MRRSPRTRLLAASVALIATFGVAACGDDDDDDAVTTDPTTLDSVVSTSPADTEVTEPTDSTDDSVSDTTATNDTTDGSTPTSGGGEVGSQDEYVDAAAAEIASEFEDAELADCVGAATVNDDVYAAIEEAGLTLDQFAETGPASLGLDETVADQIASDFAACGDLLPEIASEDDELACAEDNITNEQVAEFLAYSLLGLEASAEVQAASDAVDECIDAATTTTT